MIKKLIGAIINAVPTLAKAGSRPLFTRVTISDVPKNAKMNKKTK
jgi:hypothetical protein